MNDNEAEVHQKNWNVLQDLQLADKGLCILFYKVSCREVDDPRGNPKDYGYDNQFLALRRFLPRPLHRAPVRADWTVRRFLQAIVNYWCRVGSLRALIAFQRLDLYHYTLLASIHDSHTNQTNQDQDVDTLKDLASLLCCI